MIRLKIPTQVIRLCLFIFLLAAPQKGIAQNSLAPGVQIQNQPGDPTPISSSNEFPGKFYLIDRSDLYDSQFNMLTAGDFETGCPPGGTPLDCWTIVQHSGAPATQVIPNGYLGSQSLQITTQCDDDHISLTSQAVALPVDANQVGVSFRTRTEFGVIDPKWSQLKVQIKLAWLDAQGFALGNPTDAFIITHALRAWQPFVGEFEVVSGAAQVQIILSVEGNLPFANSPGMCDGLPHRIQFDEISLMPLRTNGMRPTLQPIEIVGNSTFVSPNKVRFTGTSISGSFEVRADFVPRAPFLGDQGTITGSVSNLAAQHKAVELIYVAPSLANVDKVSYDISRESGIEVGTSVYESTISADFYSQLRMSAVPLGSVSSAQGHTLGLAIPLDQVRLVHFRFDSRSNEFSARQHLGLEVASQAAFEFHLLRTDSAWEYRDLWNTYVTQIEPGAFSKAAAPMRPVAAQFSALFGENVVSDGTCGQILEPNAESIGGLIQDFGIRYAQTAINADPAPPDDLENTLNCFNLFVLNYDYPWMLEYDTGIPASQVPPGYAEIEFGVQTLASGSGQMQTTFEELQQIKAQNVLTDSSNDLKINRLFDPPGFGGINWLARIPIQSLTPLSNPTYAQKILSDKYDEGFTYARVLGVVFDGFMNEPKVLESTVRPGANSAAVYDPNTSLPATHLSDANLAYLDSLEAGLAMYPNAVWSANMNEAGPSIFGIPYMSMGAWEASPTDGNNFSHLELNLRRMMMMERPLGIVDKTDWCDAAYGESYLRQFCENIMHLGIYPNMLNGLTMPPCLETANEQIPYRLAIAEAINMLDAMWIAGGWQIFPHARIAEIILNTPQSSPALRLERFGTGPPYYFAVLNNHCGDLDTDGCPEALMEKDRDIRILLDTIELGLQPESVTVTPCYGSIQNLLSPVDLGNGFVQVDFSLNGKRGGVLKVED